MPWSLLGEVRWPHDKLFTDTPIGGLSSIDYDASSGLYYLVSDDRSTHAPARFYTARIDYDAAGLHQVSLKNAMPLLNRFGVTSTCRASFALYNTRAEVDALVTALRKAEAMFG